MNEQSKAGLYATYREKVLAYLINRTACREDAEDLCEEVFAEAFRCLPRYDPARASLSTWLYQITRFTLIDYFRTKHPSEPLPEDLAAADDPAEAFLKRETLDRLAIALRALDPEERDIIVLRYYKGRTLTEVSRLTGISYGMVKVKHKKALDRLRLALS